MKYVMTPDGKREARTTLEERLDKLIHIYELSIQSLIGRMPEFDKRGAKHYYQHQVFCYQQFLSELKTIRGVDK